MTTVPSNSKFKRRIKCEKAPLPLLISPLHCSLYSFILPHFQSLANSSLAALIKAIIIFSKVFCCIFFFFASFWNWIFFIMSFCQSQTSPAASCLLLQLFCHVPSLSTSGVAQGAFLFCLRGCSTPCSPEMLLIEQELEAIQRITLSRIENTTLSTGLEKFMRLKGRRCSSRRRFQ